MHLYINCEYDFIILILGKHIYITIDNISISEKEFYPKNFLDTLYIFEKINNNIIKNYKKIIQILLLYSIYLINI